ncbi:MAG: lysophospholipid acyltransferase family protein [Phycisphaerales bacterium]
MARRDRSPTHPAIDAPLGVAVRTALALATVGSPDTTRAAFESIGERFARSRLNDRRRDATRARIAFAFPDWSAERVDACATEVWRYLFRLGVEVQMTSRLVHAGSWMRHVRFQPEFLGLDEVLDGRPGVCVTAHLGNWEIIGPTLSLLGVPMQALYRPLDMRALDRWLRGVRARTGMRLVEKFGALRRLPAILDAGAIPAFVADQNAGERGEYVPFFGRLTSSYRSIAAVAQQRDAVLICGAVVRQSPPQSLGVDDLHDAATGRTLDGLGYTCIIIDAIRPEDWRGQPDPAFYITARYRHNLERLVRLAPEQYFWMHRMWKSRPAFELERRPFPPDLRQKLLALPWLDRSRVDAIEAQSAADAEAVARAGHPRIF